MSATRHQKLKDLYSASFQLAEADRAKFLNDACGDDHSLRDEVESLFQANAQVGDFMARPMMDGWAMLDEVAQVPRFAVSPLPISIGRYRVIRLIGEGGMGRVYEAEQDKPRRRVAIKVIRSSLWSRRLAARFAHEAEILARLRHPSVAQVYDAGVAEVRHAHTAESDVPFIAMELIDGALLTDYAKDNRLNDRQRLELLVQVCDAVHHGHQQGVIHRDLKPANILVERSGAAKVIDFGVARATDGDVAIATMHTDAGQILGTLAYMSPEQVSATPQQVDARSDIYSLGVIGFELLTERQPYDLNGLLVPQAARRIQETEPLRMSSISRLYRGDIETIIAKAIEKDPARRYQSASEFAADIRRYLANEPIVARPPTFRYQLGKFARRHKELVAGLMLVFVVLVAGMIATTTAMLHAQSERTIAQTEATKVKRANELLQQILRYARPNIDGGGRDVLVVDMLDAASAELAQNMHDVPELELLVRQTLGETYQRLGLYPKAVEHFERAYNLASGTNGFEPGEAAESRANLALCRVKAAELWTTESEFHQVILSELAALEPILLHARTTLGVDHRVTLKLLAAVGQFQQLRWQPEAAASSFRELLHSLERLPPDQQILSTAVVKSWLAEATALNQNFVEGEKLARDALASESDEELLIMMIDRPPSFVLATILWWSGRTDEAEQLLRHVLNLQTKALGANHFATINSSCRCLAQLLMQRERWAEALSLWERQRQYWQQRSAESGWIGYLLMYEGMALANLQQFDDAQTRYELAIAHFLKTGARHLAWSAQSDAELRIGLGATMQWKGQALRDSFCSMLRDVVFKEKSNAFELNSYMWEMGEFAVAQWVGDDQSNTIVPLMFAKGVEELRQQEDPPPGVYKISAVVPRQDRAPLECELWVLVTQWTMQAQIASRRDLVSSLGPPLHLGQLDLRVSNTLMYWFPNTFGPHGSSSSFDINAKSQVRLPEGRYQLVVDSDDGNRIWIDGEMVIDHWVKGATQQSAEVQFRGDPREIRVAYFQHGQDARLWVRMEPIPNLLN